MPPDRPPAPPPPDAWPAAAPLAAVLRDVIRRWDAVAAGVPGWDEAERAVPCAGAGWEPLARRVQLINAFQWREEDRSRDPAAGDAVLAAVKRSIDASNGRRVRAVEAFDAHVVDALAAANLLREEAPLHAESPGSIVDRLSVLALKLHHARRAEATADPAGRAAAAERVTRLEEQWTDLLGCLDRLGADVAAGRLRVKLYRQVKLYGGAAAGPAPGAA